MAIFLVLRNKHLYLGRLIDIFSMKISFRPAYHWVPAIYLVLLFAGACKKKSTVIIPYWFIDRGLSGKATWESSTGTLRITASVNWGSDNDLESFYFQPPTEVKTIVIGANVTVTGGFRFRHGVTLRGEDRNSSVIYGTSTVAWARGPNKLDNSPDCNRTTGDDRASDCLKWKYGAISSEYVPPGDTIRISSLTLLNARTYNITAFAVPIKVENVFMFEQRAEESISNCDGFGGGPGSSITNSTIDVTDDAIKLYGNLTVKNVTIVLHRNGAPFQLGWSSETSSTHTIENVLVKGTDPQRQYNCGLFSWKSTVANSIRTIGINGLKTQNLETARIWSGNTWVNYPLFELRSNNARLNINATNTSIQAASAAFPAATGTLNLNICGSSTLIASYNCGTGSAVTGNN